MLGVGIDWAEDFHLVAVGLPGEGVVQVARVEHTPAAVEALVARIAGSQPDPAEVRLVIETRHRLLVEALVDAGYTVLPVNPDLVAHRRGPARKKDDAEDAPNSPETSGGRRSLAGRSTTAFQGSEIDSPPGSPVRSATRSDSSTHRTRCNATPARPRSPDAPARANWSSPPGWPATATPPTPSSGGPSPA